MPAAVNHRSLWNNDGTPPYTVAFTSSINNMKVQTFALTLALILKLGSGWGCQNSNIWIALAGKRRATGRSPRQSLLLYRSDQRSHVAWLYPLVLPSAEMILSLRADSGFMA